GADSDHATSALILIHGRGADAESMRPLGEALMTEHMAVHIPQALSNTWYPRRFIEPIEENEPFLSSALQVIDDIVRGFSARGIPPERVVIAGFSQGACLSSEYAARNPRRYGGILVFSGGLIGPLDTQFHYEGDLKGTPAFVGCSDTDFHIPVERVHETTHVLRGLGADVTERIYPNIGHTIIQDELDAAREITAAAASR
ncbi:MAG: alpha/beta hydrolase, partial [Alkalispirochaeta sp.]